MLLFNLVPSNNCPHMTEIEIREGFLCPFCMLDLGSVTQLQTHFDEVHTTEDKAVVQQLKGLFDKAKRKIMKKDRSEDGFGTSEYNEDTKSSFDVAGLDYFVWEPQELGAVNSHTEYFKQIRDTRIDRYVVETNKLLIRLDKLITNAPTDLKKRKAYEKSVVHWVNDDDVNLCSSCGHSFNLSRRRHHCRLCGYIICTKCSEFLPFTYAKKLTNPAFAFEESLRAARPATLVRSNSNSSLNSVVNSEGEPHIRTCLECRKLLDRRDQQVEQRALKPIVAQLYERLKSCMDEAEHISPTFLKMADSLNLGETSSTLKNAQDLRFKLMKLYDSIDTLSKKIAFLEPGDGRPLSPKKQQLQKTIRIHASNFLHEYMLNMPNLPTELELEKLRDSRRKVLQKQIAKEKLAALEAQQRELCKQETLHSIRNSKEPFQSSTGLESQVVNVPRKVTVGEDGWGPMNVDPANLANSQDPMILQMNIIRNYIKQAKEAHKQDEVDMLDANLKELELEYFKQQEVKQVEQ